MIESFLDSALIIDDKEEEVSALLNLLSTNEIFFRYYHPEDLKKRETPLKSTKLIFLDLQIEEDKTTVQNVSIIRSIFKQVIGKEFRSYGIVLWSKHVDEIDELRSRMGNDAESYNLPLFIIGLDKTKYLKAGNFDSLLTDINVVLKENVASNFFIFWSNLIEEGKTNTLRSIYSLVPDYTKLQQDLQYILYKLAKNHTGIPDRIQGYKLEHDAVKAMTNILHYDITHQPVDELSLFTENTIYQYSGSEADRNKIYSSLNSKLFLDLQNIDQAIVFPGNVYKIESDSCFFSVEDSPEGAVKILIEVTPPCDFAVDKKAKRSRVLGGFYVKDFASNSQRDKFNGENFYKELNGLMVDNTEQSYKVRFDFRYFGSISEDDLKDAAQYKIMFRFKEKLFADILQKLSSHTARLGIPFIK